MGNFEDLINWINVEYVLEKKPNSPSTGWGGGQFFED